MDPIGGVGFLLGYFIGTLAQLLRILFAPFPTRVSNCCICFATCLQCVGHFLIMLGVFVGGVCGGCSGVCLMLWGCFG